jgi:hypothetical protein
MSGMGGHESPRNQKDVWLTPPSIIQALGPFDLDPCAAPEPRPWPTARDHWRPDDSPLLRAWHGRVWMNPPYGPPSVIGPWMGRMAEHGCGTALIFARTETAVFHRHVWERATALLFIEGRLNFHHADGTEADNNAGAPSVLVAYGAADAIRLATSGIGGALVMLRQAARTAA